MGTFGIVAVFVIVVLLFICIYLQKIKLEVKQEIITNKTISFRPRG